MGSVFVFPFSGDMELPKTFGEWLLARRKIAGLSLEAVAELAGVTRQYLSKIERNTPHRVTGAPPKPRLATVDAIAGALGVSISEARLAAGYAALETGAKEMAHERLLYYFNRLSPEQRDDVLAMFEALFRNQQARHKVEREQARERKTRRA